MIHYLDPYIVFAHINAHSKSRDRCFEFMTVLILINLFLVVNVLAA